MLKKVLMILMVLLLLTGCANVSDMVNQILGHNDSKKEFVRDRDDEDDDEDDENQNDTKDKKNKDEDEREDNSEDRDKSSSYAQLIINCDLQNPDAQDESYDVYLVVPGTLDFTPGNANQDFYYKIETDENNQAVLDVTDNWDFEWYVSDAIENHEGMMEIWITTKEDIYLRNPLNQETIVKFIEKEEMDYTIYESTVDEIYVPFVDSYPKGVLSLTFQDATFVIKLEFPEGYEPTSSFIVSINIADEFGMEWKNGRIDREFQYWDTPFFATDGLVNVSGIIEIRDYDTDNVVSYEGEPMSVTFDENGECTSGNIVVLKVIP